jgi:hypothetical protein
VELAALAKSFDNKTVTAVLRPLPGKKVAILLSAEVKKWIAVELDSLQANLPKDLADFTKELVGWIKADEDFRLLCKQSSKGVLQLGVTLDKEVNGQSTKETVWQNKLAIDLGKTTFFPNVVTPAQGLRLQIELDPIS